MTALVGFRTGDGKYAVPVECVREVCSGDALVPPRGQQRECISGVVPTDDGPVLLADIAMLDERLER
jgi:hypothetical protein